MPTLTLRWLKNIVGEKSKMPMSHFRTVKNAMNPFRTDKIAMNPFKTVKNAMNPLRTVKMPTLTLTRLKNIS